VISSSGTYGELGVDFEIRVDGTGRIQTDYRLFGSLPFPGVRGPAWVRHAEGFSEVGVVFLLSAATDELSWDRKGLWSAYPAHHIGRNAGTALRGEKEADEVYGHRPEGPWSSDEADFFLFGRKDAGGRGSADFRSLKENIWSATALQTGPGRGVRVESDGSAAVRLEVVDPGADGRVRLIVDDLWNYPELGWGNYMKNPILVGAGYASSVELRLVEKN
jgi:hypothetical protein